MMHSIFIAALSTFLLLAIGACPPNTCGETQTCCRGSIQDSYGCCPLVAAVCCSDGIHCCPQNTVCNITDGYCYEKKENVHPITTKKSVETKTAAVQSANHSNITRNYCPGHQSYCNDGTTCCLVPGGPWRCCPYSEATCCSDGLYCCPHGQRCDSASHQCFSEGGQYEAPVSDTKSSAVETEASVVQNENHSNITRNYCPGHQYYCNDGTTCCLVPGGPWTCCASSLATCCADGRHCCPHGQRCDSTSQHCFSEGGQYEAPVSDNKSSAVETKAAVVQSANHSNITRNYCPGHQSYCNDSTTCCLVPGGPWRCCPYSEATCCSDGLYCCPHGQRCDSASHQCFSEGSQYEAPVSNTKSSAVETKAAVVQNANHSNITRNYCPGHQSYCNDGTTCCLVPGGPWTCCPYSLATCCVDGRHCCPHGQRCDATSQYCN